MRISWPRPSKQRSVVLGYKPQNDATWEGMPYATYFFSIAPFPAQDPERMLEQAAACEIMVDDERPLETEECVTEENRVIPESRVVAEERRIVEEQERHEPKAESKRLEPGKRGGRPRAQSQDHEQEAVQEPESHGAYSITPEIVCLKIGRKWIPAVEVPEDLLQNADLSVLHDGVPLSRDGLPRSQEEFAQGCWPLKQVCGEVTVQWNGEESFQMALGQESCLLFKLSGKYQNEGRLVKFPSSGSYLAIVPDNWERDDDPSGPPPAAPEAVSLAGCRAHFFDLEQNSGKKIVFRTPDGPFELKPKAVRFALAGKQLNDATENRGPLFGQVPPKIRALGARRWKDVKTIVVGEEGSGKGKWRMAFHPDPEQSEQDLPLEFAARKGGWYFLRFYDSNDDLMESLDFRFLRPLKEIKISQPPPLPGEGGHRPTCVEFFHEPGCVVRPSNGSSYNHGEIPAVDHGQVLTAEYNIQREYDKTILTIPADPAYDETCWSVSFEDGPEAARVEVTILVERVWWAVGEENSAPSEWGDGPLALARSDFAAISRKALWLRLPGSHRVNKVLVGFKRPKARPCSIKTTEKMVAIPLRDFCDCPEIQAIGTASLGLWIPFQRTIQEGTPCKLTIKMHCTSCGFEASNEAEMLSHVRAQHITDFFRALNYEEIRDRVPSLPYKIYLCSYCNYYAKSDDLDNPTSVISEHIVKECQGVSRAEGRAQVSFIPISDTDEIRKHVIHNLPRIYRCQLCSCESDTEEDMKNHLIENHKNDLCELR